MNIIYTLLFMLNEMSAYILAGFLIAGIMHAFIPQSTFARHLSGSDFKTVIKSAAIGVPLPLCSCGVLPTAIGMRRNGASKAATTAFLVATPQTGADSIAATWSMLGPAFAVVRPLAALATALCGGLATGKTCDHGCDTPDGDTCEASGPERNRHQKESFGQKCMAAVRYGFVDLVGSLGGWLVAGLIIAALITVYVPAETFAVFTDKPLLSMLAVLLIAIPMYVCATGSIPIALSLMMKGLSPGTALVLLMAGPAANFASFTLISREMGKKTAFVYLGSIVAGAISFGLIIDYLLPASWFAVPSLGAGCTHHENFGIFSTICSGVLLSLLTYSFIRNHRHNHNITTDMTTEYNISGMNCPHCQAAVTRAIAAVEGVENVDVFLNAGKAIVEGKHDSKHLINAVRSAGFDASLKEDK